MDNKVTIKSIHIRNYIWGPHNNRKSNIVKLVATASAIDKKEYIDGFRNPIIELEKRFL